MENFREKIHSIQTNLRQKFLKIYDWGNRKTTFFMVKNDRWFKPWNSSLSNSFSIISNYRKKNPELHTFKNKIHSIQAKKTQEILKIYQKGKHNIISFDGGK